MTCPWRATSTILMREFTDLEQTRMLGVLDTAQRARLTWFKIQWKPTSVVMTRPRVVTKTGTTPEVTLDPQVVRIDGDSRANLVSAVAGARPVWQAEITGIVDHPQASIVDTDIEEGYTFVHNNDRYRITEVWRDVPGLVRAIALVNG